MIDWTQFPDLMGVADLARLFEVDKSSIYNWKAAGRLPPSIELGGTKWRKRDIMILVEGQRVAADMEDQAKEMQALFLKALKKAIDDLHQSLKRSLPGRHIKDKD